MKDKQRSTSPESDGGGSKPSRPKRKKTSTSSSLPPWLTHAVLTVTVIPLLAYAAHFAYMHYVYLPSLVSTPSPLPKVTPPGAFNATSSPDLYWGTYGANLYFGMRTRSPDSPTFGVMWFEQPRMEEKLPDIRHWSDQGDKLRYGWAEHDGRSFGVQTIQDNGYELVTSFVKRQGGTHGGEWTARVSLKAKIPQGGKSNRLFSVIPYFAVRRGSGALMEPVVEEPDREGDVTGRTKFISAIKGSSPDLGRFSLHFSTPSNLVSRSFAATHTPDEFDMIKESLLNETDVLPMQSDLMKHFLTLRGYAAGVDRTAGSNLLAAQMTVLGSTEFDIAFESGSYDSKRPARLIGEEYTKALEQKRNAFDTKFERIFGLTAAGHAGSFLTMGRYALSNMLGSVSYFYGYSLVTSEHVQNGFRPYGPLELFTAIPSRPFFPRGFLWDEGFHHLLIRKFDADLSLEILGSWLDLMNVEGWIPRELILGKEAFVKVPMEFVVQNSAYANPPMFLYLLSKYAKDEAFVKKHKSFFDRALPRLEVWYNWLNGSQSGPEIGSYRWRGRNETTPFELNPKTLTSGFDDYPRASHPSNAEYHLDLYCWMAMSSRLLAKLHTLVGEASQGESFAATADLLYDSANLERLHWSSKTQRFCDYGLHTRNVKLERKAPPKGRPELAAQMPMVRVATSSPQMRLVTDTFGYVSLFPLLMRLLPPESPKLSAVIKDLQNPDLLWSQYGLRSLARTAPLYNTRNTEHDPPYWRGYVWLNVNYLALDALYYYGKVAGPYRNDAYDVYVQLRQNVLSNVGRQFAAKGTLFENYDDQTGEGRGCNPFTGWSSLVLLIMSEKYD